MFASSWKIKRGRIGLACADLGLFVQAKHWDHRPLRRPFWRSDGSSASAVPGNRLGYAAKVTGEGIQAARWSTPGDGERLWFLGTLATIKLPGEASDGRFALIEFLFPHHASPPLHTHPQDESYIVLEGRLTIQAGEHRFELEAGGAATVPMRVAHTFRVDSQTATVLVLSTPAGLERMVRDGAVPASTPTLPPADAPRPAPEQLERVFEAHGQVNLGPPLGPLD